MANSVDPDQTAPIGAVCSGSTLFASILDLSVMLGNYLQQTTSDDFQMHFFPCALRVNHLTRPLTLCLLVSSADSLCKQFGPISGQKNCWALSGSKLFV